MIFCENKLVGLKVLPIDMARYTPRQYTVLVVGVQLRYVLA